MKIQERIEKIRAQAEKFRTRAKKGADEKRHDVIQPDEQECMLDAKKVLGWSYVRIGGVFGRNWRSVKKAIESYRPSSKKSVPSLGIGSVLNTLFTDRLDYAKFASVKISVAGDIEAKGCWGWVRILPSGPTLPLHWRGTAFTEEQTDTSRIIIRPEKAANLNVAFALPSGRVVDTVSLVEACPEVPVFFSGRMPQPDWHGEGCWLAQPSALHNPDPRLEAYLTPGTYQVNISVGCEGGKGDSRDFTLKSPTSWEELELLTEKKLDVEDV